MRNAQFEAVGKWKILINISLQRTRYLMRLSSSGGEHSAEDRGVGGSNPP